MAAYALRRILWLGPALFFISLVTFALMHAVQGGPWDDDRALPSTTVENLNRKYGLDRPLWEQYALFAGNALRGDLGISTTRQDKPVTQIMVSGFRITGILGVMALAVAAVAGIGLGVLSAVNRNRLADYTAVGFASAGAAIPAFVLGVFLIYVFGVKLGWFATFGWDTRHGVVPGWLPRWDQMVLPVITLAALPAAYLARVTRASLLEVLRQDYMRTARAKGLPETTVLVRHALRNAAIPILSVLGPLTAGLVTGSFIVEYLFSVPGSGRLLVESISARDYNLIMGATLFYAAVIVLANLAVDLAYAIADPRVHLR